MPPPTMAKPRRAASSCMSDELDAPDFSRRWATLAEGRTNSATGLEGGTAHFASFTALHLARMRTYSASMQLEAMVPSSAANAPRTLPDATRSAAAASLPRPPLELGASALASELHSSCTSSAAACTSGPSSSSNCV